MKNTKISLIALAAGTIAAGISFLLLKTEKAKRKTNEWRKNSQVYLEVAHDIQEGLSEEVEGLKNRLFSVHCK